MAYFLCIGFTRGEYHIVCVDFIVALRRTKGRRRRTLRSPSPPSSGLHLLTPGYPLRRGISAAAVDRDIGSLYPVQVAHPHFDISFGCFVFGLWSFAFQSGCWAWIVRFSLLGGWSFVPAATVGFTFSFVELPLTAPFFPISLDASPFHQICRVQKYCKTAFMRLKLQENGYPVQAPPLTIQLSHTGYTAFHPA